MSLDYQPIYVLASGGERAIEQLDIIANNIANISTGGFKKILMEELSQTVKGSKESLTFPGFKNTKILPSQGKIVKTGRKLDIAILGNGYFKVKARDKVMFTRNGHLFVNENNILVDHNGYPVLDENSNPISIQPEQAIHITKDGTIFQKGKRIARLSVEAYKWVKPIGSCYYQPEGSRIKVSCKLLSGYLELSNINPVSELADLINTQRRFEMYMNLIKSIDNINIKSCSIGRM